MKRVFTVFTEPHMADPAWVCPVYETRENADGSQGPCIAYTNGDELLKVAQKLKDDMTAAFAANDARNEVLSLFGLTLDEYVTKLKERRASETKPTDAL